MKKCEKCKVQKDVQVRVENQFLMSMCHDSAGVIIRQSAKVCIFEKKIHCDLCKIRTQKEFQSLVENQFLATMCHDPARVAKSQQVDGKQVLPAS